MLSVVPTPIGNLNDITYRALETLKKADLILAEDTRTSGVLLKHFDIDTPSQSYHMHNEHKTLDKWIAQLLDGKHIALISDAGTPAISDPGFLLGARSYPKRYHGGMSARAHRICTGSRDQWTTGREVCF